MLKNRYFCIRYKNSRDTMFPQLFHRPLLVCVLLAFSVFTRAQFTTLVRITDPGLIPVVDTAYRFTDGVDGVRLVSEDPRLNEILQSFTFYDFAMLDSLSSNPAVRQYFVFRFYSTGNRNRFRRDIEMLFSDSFTEWSNIVSFYGNYYEEELINKRIKIVASNTEELFALSFYLEEFSSLDEDYLYPYISEKDLDLRPYLSRSPQLDSLFKTFSIRALLLLEGNRTYLQFISNEEKIRFLEAVTTLFPDRFQDVREFTKEDWNITNLAPKVQYFFFTSVNLKFNCIATFLNEYGQPIPNLKITKLHEKALLYTSNTGLAIISSLERSSCLSSGVGYPPHFLIVSDVDGSSNGCFLTDTIFVNCKLNSYRSQLPAERQIHYEFSSHFVYTMYPVSQCEWEGCSSQLVNCADKATSSPTTSHKSSKNFSSYNFIYYPKFDQDNHHPYFEYKVSSEAIRQYFRANRKQSVDGTKLDWKYGEFSEFSFQINKKGKIVKESITLISDGDINSPKNQELIRLLASMPRWTPAVRNGKRVECRCKMYIDHLLSRTSNLRLTFYYLK